MKIIDASKLIQWIQNNNNGDDWVKMWPLLEYISDAENHQPHGHGRYVQDISAKFTNPEQRTRFDNLLSSYCKQLDGNRSAV